MERVGWSLRLGIAILRGDLKDLSDYVCEGPCNDTGDAVLCGLKVIGMATFVFLSDLLAGCNFLVVNRSWQTVRA